MGKVKDAVYGVSPEKSAIWWGLRGRGFRQGKRMKKHALWGLFAFP